jgi:hypothetical protein
VILILNFQFVGDHLPCQFVRRHSESLKIRLGDCVRSEQNDGHYDGCGIVYQPRFICLNTGWLGLGLEWFVLSIMAICILSQLGFRSSLCWRPTRELSSAMVSPVCEILSQKKSTSFALQTVERNGRHVGTRTPDLYRVKTWFGLGSTVQECVAVAISRVPDRNTAVPAYPCSQAETPAIRVVLWGNLWGRSEPTTLRLTVAAAGL